MATVATGISPATTTPTTTQGIEPVPFDQRRLTGFDLAILWGDLGVGLLVLQAGALLYPGLGALDGLGATVVGSVIGVILLGLAAYVAADAGVPTMVLARGAMGIRGSALPTILNVIQLVGWTSFEILVMAQFANAIVEHFTGFSAYPLWALVFTVVCVALALGGPLVVVRQWLEKFGVWAMLVTSLALFALLATRFDLRAVLATQGSGDLSFWLGVDIVVALPISWFPLVADYNRFARTRSGSFWGTVAGYLLANVTFFALGLLYVIALNTDVAHLNDELVGFLGGSAILGGLALLIILADETDEGFADIYSAAVSTQNLVSRVPQRALITAYAALGFVLAILLQNADYEWFLLLIGSFFVPLLGVIVADYFAVHGRYVPGELFDRGGPHWYQGGVNVLAVVAWIVGFSVYQWIAPPAALAQALGDAFSPLVSPIGATIPSFAVAFLLYALVGRLVARR